VLTSVFQFSASPGRYILTDIKDGNNGEQSVDIIAKYPWGEQLIESLKVVNDVKSVATSQLQVRSATYLFFFLNEIRK
jgi:hypothetical protein